MKNSIKIALFLIAILALNISYSNEKFVKVKGAVSHNSVPLNNYSIHINFDNIDSNTINFDKQNFDFWLPANRKAKVSFIKKGFVPIHMIVDGSFIPSFAYKKKQLIEFNVKMVKAEKFTKAHLKPFCTANFKASQSRFFLTYHTLASKKEKKFRPPFQTPYSTFVGAKPVNKYLTTIEKVNRTHKRKSHSYFQLVQGTIYAHLNYSIFNERMPKANDYLDQLRSIEKDAWTSIKPFDTPEYAAIVMKTINSKKSKDTLFALGSWIGTSQLLFQSFTSNSKLIIHGKKLIYALKYYTESNLNDEQKQIVEALRNIALTYDELVRKYLKGMKNKSPIKLIEDPLFLQIKSENQTIYNTIIQ